MTAGPKNEEAPTPRELEILRVLWEIKSGSVRQIHERLSPDGELAFNTVQTFLRNMETKGLVEHAERGHTFIYSPKYRRETLAKRMLNQVFGGALDQLVLTLVDDSDVEPARLRELEKAIAKARKERESAGNKDSAEPKRKGRNHD